MSAAFDRAELIADFGEAGLLTLIAAFGGTTRYVPLPHYIEHSRMAAAIGVGLTAWLSARFGGEEVRFPSKRSLLKADKAAALRSAVLAAGLRQPRRSANEIAKEFGVGQRHVEKVRSRLRAEQSTEPALPSPETNTQHAPGAKRRRST